MAIDSGVDKQLVKVALPREEHHQTSDAEQLAAAIGVTAADVPAGVLASLPQALRDDPAGVTVTTFAGPHPLRRARRHATSMRFGLAIDVGTTSVVTTLLELTSGEQLASVSSLNPQAVFGADLMSRIAFAQFDAGNLRKLHTRIVGLLNQHVAEVCRHSGVLAKWIYKAVVVGNTCMHHVLLGIDPSYVGLAPYAPVMRHPLVVPARDLFLKLAPEARVCLLPIVAGFVGADAVAVALATRIYEGEDAARGGGHRHQRRGAPRLGPAGCGRARRRLDRRSRADRSATACAGRPAPSTVSRSTTTCASTRSARRPRWESAAPGCSTWWPGCSTRA